MHVVAPDASLCILKFNSARARMLPTNTRDAWVFDDLSNNYTVTGQKLARIQVASRLTEHIDCQLAVYNS